MILQIQHIAIEPETGFKSQIPPRGTSFSCLALKVVELVTGYAVLRFGLVKCFLLTALMKYSIYHVHILFQIFERQTAKFEL